ncbi:hypothetical protein [Mucilaginibacter antarcticus]
MMGDNYQGVLALGDDQFIFDARSPSKYWMPYIKPFKIFRQQIKDIEISEQKSFKKRKLTIILENDKKAEFLLSNGEQFYKEMKSWLAKN